MAERVEDRGNRDDWGRRESIALEIDKDGDVRFSSDGVHDEFWIHPEALVAALRRLGVLPKTDTLRRRDRSETPSDRIREGWRKAAADNPREREEIQRRTDRQRVRVEFARAAEERAAFARLREAERARVRAAKLAGPKFYRDRDGDTWRSTADGRLALYRMQMGDRVDADVAEYRWRENVDRLYGPLTEVADPFAPTGPAIRVTTGVRQERVTPSIVEALRMQVQRDMDNSAWWRSGR